MKVSIIIRCYNEEEHIGRLLQGIEHQDHPEIEVLVVDSGSTDSTVAIARKYNTKLVHIKKEEFSFGRALNMGCEAASGDLLLFASAHVYPVFEDWIAKMAAPFADEKVALVYGKQRGDHRNKFSEHQLFKQWFPEQSNYNQTLPFCNNANCCVRKSLWIDQRFDEKLTGLEDLDWAKKILNKGYKIAYEAGAPIIHVHEENAQIIRNRYRREAIALKRINPEARFTFFQFIRLFVVNTLHDLKVARKEGMFSEKWREIFMFRYNQFYGTWQGYQVKDATLSQKLRERYYYPPLEEVSLDDQRSEKRIHYNE